LWIRVAAFNIFNSLNHNSVLTTSTLLLNIQFYI